jgi:hypothetical protein
MLTAQEQADLYAVYAATFGDDLGVKQAQNRFNEDTVKLVETAVVEAANCNTSMKRLVADLFGGSSILTKGWLRKGLKKLSKKIAEPGVKFNGYACLAIAKSRYRSVILETTYY